MRKQRHREASHSVTCFSPNSIFPTRDQVAGSVKEGGVQLLKNLKKQMGRLLPFEGRAHPGQDAADADGPLHS